MGAKIPKNDIFTLNLGLSQQLQEYKHLKDSKARHVPLMKLIGHWVLPVDLILKDTEHQYNPWIVKRRNIAVQILFLFNFGGGVDKVGEGRSSSKNCPSHHEFISPKVSVNRIFSV